MPCTYRLRSFIVALLALVLLDPASGASMDWRPFVVRADLAPGRIVRKTMHLPAAFEKNGYDPALNGNIPVDRGKEQRWSDFQFGSFRLRISRYYDRRSKSDPYRSDNARGPWDAVKALPGSPSRETLETMGKLFTPHLDLGIEF